MFNKIFKYALPIFLIFSLLFSCLPLTVFAYGEDEAKLIVQGNVDPRVKAKGSSVALTFYNLETGDEYLVYLHDYNNYRNSIDIKKGYYSTRSAYVIGDLEFKYDVEFVNFMAQGWTAEVQVTVGDPNYKGEITDIKDKHDLPGAIDRDKTNELLTEDGLPTVDWDKVDKEFQKDSDGDGIPDIYDDDDDNDGIRDFDDDDRDGNGIKNEDEKDTYIDGTPVINKPIDENKNPENSNNSNEPEQSTGNKDPENPNNSSEPEQSTTDDKNNEDNENDKKDDEEKDNEKKGNKGFAIIFVIILIIACGAVLFVKFKNSLNNDEE